MLPRLTSSLTITRRFVSSASAQKGQWILHARDYTDEKALERRLSVRESHLARTRIAKKQGLIFAGGAILDGNGKMIGSCVITGPSWTREEAEKYFNEDPYVTGKVWEGYTLEPFRLANID